MLLQVDATDTIEIIKSKIQDRVVILPEQQKLYFLGKSLENDRTLADYNIQTGNTIDLYLVVQESSRCDIL
jgi:ubiquitin C